MSSHPLPIPDKKAKFKKEQFLKIAPRLIALLKPHNKNLSIGFLALIGASALNLLFPYIIRTYLNENVGKVLSDNLGKITLVLIALFIFQGFLFFVRHYFLQIVGLKITADLKNLFFDKLIRHKISFFDQNRLGDLLSRLNADSEMLQKGLSVNVSVTIRYGIQVLGGLILMILLSFKLTLIILALVPLLAVFSIKFSRYLKDASKKTQEYLAQTTVSAEEALAAIRVVKLFGTENLEARKFSELNNQAYEFGNLRTKIAAAFSSSMVTVLHISIGIVFFIGGLLVSNGSMSIGDFTAFLLYCTIVAVSFGFLVNSWAEFVQSLGAAERIFEIIDESETEQTLAQNLGKKETRDLGKDLAKNLGLNSPKIEFKRVSFNYPSRPDVNVLKDISFKIPTNQTTALVGHSGSGKSTIATLIPRLYEVTEGSILLEGQNINSIPLNSLRSKIAFVPQNPQMFSTSLRANIIYGETDATEAQLNKAISDSALNELIAKLPNGLDTLVGDKGIQLSGGERQRISIARALLNPIQKY